VHCRFPQFRILLACQRNRDLYTWLCRIHKDASGEKGMRPDFSFQHFFSACFMYSSSSLSNLFSCFDIASLGSLEEAVLTIRSIRGYHSIFLFRALLYRWAHPSILVFNQRRAGWIIFCMQPVPTSNVVVKFTTKRQWSPMPYPTGITHTFATVTSLVAHMASIGTLPWK
jgi:hypothetical protein